MRGAPPYTLYSSQLHPVACAVLVSGFSVCGERNMEVQIRIVLFVEKTRTRMAKSKSGLNNLSN